MWTCDACHVNLGSDSFQEHIKYNHISADDNEDENEDKMVVFTCGQCQTDSVDFEGIARHCYDECHDASLVYKGPHFDRYLTRLFIGLDGILKKSTVNETRGGLKGRILSASNSDEIVENSFQQKGRGDLIECRKQVDSLKKHVVNGPPRNREDFEPVRKKAETFEDENEIKSQRKATEVQGMGSDEMENGERGEDISFNASLGSHPSQQPLDWKANHGVDNSITLNNDYAGSSSYLIDQSLSAQKEQIGEPPKVGLSTPKTSEAYSSPEKSQSMDEKSQSAAQDETAKSLKGSSPITFRSAKTGRKTYPCSYCFKIFPKSTKRKVHERTHTGEKPYLCHLCSKRFSFSGNLRSHIKRHSGVRPFECTSGCSKTFTRKEGLLSHTRAAHTDERPFKCKLCGKAYARHTVLYKHERNCRFNIDSKTSVLTAQQRFDDPTGSEAPSDSLNPTRELEKILIPQNLA